MLFASAPVADRRDRAPSAPAPGSCLIFPRPSQTAPATVAREWDGSTGAALQRRQYAPTTGRTGIGNRAPFHRAPVRCADPPLTRHIRGRLDRAPWNGIETDRDPPLWRDRAPDQPVPVTHPG